MQQQSTRILRQGKSISSAIFPNPEERFCDGGNHWGQMRSVRERFPAPVCEACKISAVRLAREGDWPPVCHEGRAKRPAEISPIFTRRLRKSPEICSSRGRTKKSDGTCAGLREQLAEPPLPPMYNPAPDATKDHTDRAQQNPSGKLRNDARDRVSLGNKHGTISGACNLGRVTEDRKRGAPSVLALALDFFCPRYHNPRMLDGDT